MEETWGEDASAILIARRALAEQSVENVKESWDDDDEEVVVPEPVPETSANKSSKPATFKPKSNSKAGQNYSQAIDERTLTAQEIEELQKKSDLQHLKDAFGITDDQKTAFSTHEPATKEDFKQFSEFVISEIQKHSKKKEYSEFLSELFRSICLDLDSEHVKRYSKDLSILATELQKREKDNEKSKQKASKKTTKPAITLSRRGMLDDIADAGEFYDGADDDDFM